MRIHKISLAVAAGSLAIVSLATPVSAQDAGKAQQVLAAARKAIGDRKIDTLKTFIAEARVQRNVGTFQASSDVEVYIDLPDKYARSEMPSGQMNFSSRQGFNGDRPLARAGRAGGGAFMVRMGPNGPEPIEKPTPEQEAEMAKMALRSARHEASRMMLGWFAMAHPAMKAEYTYAGEAESADGKAHVIDVKDGEGFAVRLFIDQQTNLPLMVTYQAPKRTIVGGGVRVQAGAPVVQQSQAQAPAAGGVETARRAAAEPAQLVEYRLYFADWAEMDGIRFPQKIQRAVEGTPEEEWNVAKIKVNPKIDAKKFEAGS